MIGKVAAPLTTLFTRLCEVAKSGVAGAKSHIEPVWQALDIVTQVGGCTVGHGYCNIYADFLLVERTRFARVLRGQYGCVDGRLYGVTQIAAAGAHL